MLTLRSRQRLKLGLIVTIAVSFWYLYSIFFSVPMLDPTYGRLGEFPMNSRYAIATFLTGDSEDYFTAARLLTYQLLHANETRCSSEIPVLALVTSTVSQRMRDQLQKDGAEVVSVKDVPLQWWINTGVTRWKDQFTKLRVFEMVQYDRILFIDADTILTRPIDGIFDEKILRRPSNSKLSRRLEIRRDEARLPAQYVFAARSDNSPSGERSHPFPPIRSPKFSAGFWVASPSKEMYIYMLSVMQRYRRFNPHEMEQSLLNYVFRRQGTMPWLEVDYRWTATWPNMKDWDGGVASLHEKFWKAGPDELRSVWLDWKGRMDAFYKDRENLSDEEANDTGDL